MFIDRMMGALHIELCMPIFGVSSLWIVAQTATYSRFLQGASLSARKLASLLSLSDLF